MWSMLLRTLTVGKVLNKIYTSTNVACNTSAGAAGRGRSPHDQGRLQSLTVTHATHSFSIRSDMVLI